MNEIETMYNDIIMDHYILSTNKKNIVDCTHEKKGVNPNCGDEITLKIKIENNLIIDAAFLGEGCAVSISSTSIMIDLIKGKSVKDALSIIDNFKKMINKEKYDATCLNEACVFENVSNMPARIKCANLCYNTLSDILKSI